jgi:hypothetical protein
MGLGRVVEQIEDLVRDAIRGWTLGRQPLLPCCGECRDSVE